MGTVHSSIEGIAGEVSHLKLYVLWVVDVSGSMHGSKIQRVNWAIKHVLPELERLEDEERVKVFICTIIFNDRADWHGGDTPVEVSRFRWQDIATTGGNTSTTQAIELLGSALQREKFGRRSVPPLCILLSDGHCTDPEDRYNQAIEQLNALPWGAKAVRLSIGIGERDGYNKAQLDQFISPYLRAQGVETLPADNPRKLMEYIILTVTTVTNRLTNSHRSTHIAPVVVSMDDLTNSAAVDDPTLPDPNEVF